MAKNMTNLDRHGHVIIVSGPRGAGKTTVIKNRLEQLRVDQLDVAGILSLPVEVNGEKVAIDGLDLRSGDIQQLAIRNSGGSGQLTTRQWQFDPDAMQWADKILAVSTPCDVLVVDEFGVLEFERGRGWMAGLKTVDDGHYRAAIVVIRPELQVKAQERWENAAFIEITIDTRDEARNKLAELTGHLMRSPKTDK
jgi:nucleoside-triphosphatase THEP1